MLGADFDDAFGLVVRGLDAEPAQDVTHELDVAQVRHAADDARFARQQCGGDDGQSGVFRSADLDSSPKRIAPGHDNLFHSSLLGESYLLLLRFPNYFGTATITLSCPCKSFNTCATV